ncbi:MAG: molecular chaperone HtpG, partial [Chlamydiia bacterium]|nr:molecular chaperone HtpG [Chlamydiia bacterium]
DSLPALLIVDENQRRLRDYLILTQGKQSSHQLQPKKSFIVNTNNRLVQAIEKLSSKEPQLAKELAKSLYHLSLLGQREVKPGELEQVLMQQTTVLEKLATLIS